MEQIFDGPVHVYGNMGNLQQPAGTVVEPDPNGQRAPSLFFMGEAIPDIRLFYPKDKVPGYTGVVPSHFHMPTIESISQIPSALAANNIAAAQTVTSGTAMTLASASLGVTLAVPIVPFSNSYNGATVVTTALALDFGFAFGSCTANSATITVADSSLFSVGMPLVIGGVGNSGGTIPLLTQVATIPTGGTTITVIASAVPLATNATAPIGTGNIWGPSENGWPVPTAASPYLATGSLLSLDPRQAISRGVRVVGVSGGTGGNFLVSGYDIYGQPVTQLVTVAAGASTGWSTKCFAYIVSVVPQFTDGSHNYTVGTSDVFEFVTRSDLWEYTGVVWDGTPMATATGWVAGVQTSPATNLTGDVRGTIQVSTNGGGTGLTGSASNGSVVSLAMSGRRMFMAQDIPVTQMIRGFVTNPVTIYGVTQV